MNAGLKSYILPTLLAVVFHGVLVFLTATTWFDSTTAQHKIMPRHIKAELVDLRSQTQAKEQARRADAKNKATQQRKADAKKKADAKRKAAAKKKADAKRKAAAKKKADAKRKAAAKKKADAKRKVAAKKKADAKRKAAAKKKADAKRKAEAQRIAEQAERERLQQELQREQQARDAADKAQQQAQQRAEAEQVRVAQSQQLVASAVDVIRSGVQSQWRRPPSARNGMVVGVRIHLLPTGEVDDAYVIKASGDEAFDRSAVNAVLKAERFPELQGLDPLVFDRNLRRITLEFRPEDLRL